MKNRLIFLGWFFLMILGPFMVLMTFFSVISRKTLVSKEEVVVIRNYVPLYLLDYKVDLLNDSEEIFQFGLLTGDFQYITYEQDRISYISMRKSGHKFYLKDDGQVIHRMQIAEETLSYEQCHSIFEAALAERNRIREKYSHLIPR